MDNNIIDNIKYLPPLPKSFERINNICLDSNCEIGDLTKAIESDPMLVANLLKIANSSMYGFKKTIKSCLQAVSLFGVLTTRSLIIEASIKKLLSLDMEPYGITPEEFAYISSLQSLLVMKWYKRIDASKAEDLFLAAILQNTGKILIANEIIKNNEVYQFKSQIETTSDIAKEEKIYVNTTTAEITSRMLEHWGFDKKLANMIKHSDNYEDAEKLREYSLVLKILKTAIPVNSPLSDKSINIACKILEKEGMDKQFFTEKINEIKEQIK